MAFNEFLAHVRTARSLIPPDVLAVGLAADPRHVQKALASADVWLRPAFVEPSHPPPVFPQGLELLPDPAVNALLIRNMASLRDLTTRVGDDRPPTDAERREGLLLLLQIIPWVRQLAFEPATEDLADYLWARLEEKYPDYVLGFECEFRADWSGDRSVRVWATVPDNTPVETERFGQFDRDITTTVQEWARTFGRAEFWSYSRFRTPEDMRLELAGVDE